MFETNPSAKVRFLALGELPSPGSCLVCGSGTREEGYVDLGVWLEYVGEGLLCVTCIIEIGECIKMLSIDEAAQIKVELNGIIQKNTLLKATVEEQDERLAAYHTLLGNLPISSIGNAASNSDPGDTPLFEAVKESGSGESEVEESSINDGGFAGFGETESSDITADESEPAGLLKL